MILNTNGSIYYSGSTSTSFIVGKLTSAGSSDTSFGYNGTGRVTYVGAQVGAIINNTSFLAKQPDGKLIVATYSAAGAVNSGSVSTNFDYVFMRILPSGDLDDTFGFDGRIIIPISNTNFASGQSSTDILSAIGIHPDGKIIGTGRSFGSDFVYHFASVRLDRTGMLDTSFGSAGRIDYGINGLNCVAKSLLFQSDGKIVMAGFVKSGSKLDFAIQRVNP